MTKRRPVWVLGGVLLVLVLALVSTVGVLLVLREYERWSMSADLDRLRVGMTAQEVEAILGPAGAENPNTEVSVPAPDGGQKVTAHSKAWSGRRFMIRAYFDREGKLIHKNMVPLGYSL